MSAFDGSTRAIGLSFVAVVTMGLSSCGREDDAPKATPTSAKGATATGMGDDTPGRPGGKVPRFRPGGPRSSMMAAKGTAPDEETSASYHASKYSSSQMPTPGQPPATKTLAPASPRDLEQTHALKAKAEAATAKSDALRLIEEASSMQHEGLYALVGGWMLNADPEIQGRALALLEGTDSPEALSAVETGLKSTDEDVRLEALEVAKGINDPKTANLLQGVLSDPDKDVRQAGLAASLQQRGAQREQLLAAATTSPYADVAIAALNVVRSESHKATMPLIIAALGHANPLVRDLAHETLYMNFQNDLQSPAQALQWWDAHQGLFDEQLQLKDPETLPLILPK